jgi:CPA2 family monovalent cation:H+ antiporter-2
MILEVLANQAQSSDAGSAELRRLHDLMPGLGDPSPVRLSPDSFAVGKTLARLNLRGLTGATVLAIARGSEGVLVPTGKETLRPGDVLALAGPHDAIATAHRLLLEGDLVSYSPGEPRPSV